MTPSQPLKLRGVIHYNLYSSKRSLNKYQHHHNQDQDALSTTELIELSKVYAADSKIKTPDFASKLYNIQIVGLLTNGKQLSVNYTVPLVCLFVCSF